MKPVRLAILCAVALCLATAHAVANRLLKPPPPPPPAAAQGATGAPAPGAPVAGRKNPAHRDSTLTAAEIHKLLDEGAIVVVDARPADQFAEGHMPSAFHIPFELFRRGRPDVLDFLQPEERIVIYCGGGDCEASHHVQEMLHEYGFFNSEVYLPGWPGWVEYGGPIETGAPR
jgi:rhodanese-related sulfurtransferase